jgi:Flp pilus assembly protein TadD
MKATFWALFLLTAVFPARAQVILGQSSMTVTVRVVEAGTGAPVARARVELSSYRAGGGAVAFTDDRGRAEFPDVARQPYAVRVSCEGFHPSEERAEANRNDFSVDVTVELRRVEARVQAAPGLLIPAARLAVPRKAAAELEKGLRQLNRGQAGRSLRHFEKALASYPEYYEAHYLAGMAYLELRDAEKAEAALRKAVEMNAGFLLPVHPLAVVLLARRELDEAERLLLRAQERDPEGWQWPYELARCHGTRGDWPKALPYGLRARAHEQAPAKVHLLMVDIYRNLGDYPKAIEELEAFAHREPRSPLLPRVEAMLRELRDGS